MSDSIIHVSLETKEIIEPIERYTLEGVIRTYRMHKNPETHKNIGSIGKLEFSISHN